MLTDVFFFFQIILVNPSEEPDPEIITVTPNGNNLYESYIRVDEQNVFRGQTGNFVDNFNSLLTKCCRKFSKKIPTNNFF